MLLDTLEELRFIRNMLPFHIRDFHAFWPYPHYLDIIFHDKLLFLWGHICATLPFGVSLSNTLHHALSSCSVSQQKILFSAYDCWIRASNNPHRDDENQLGARGGPRSPKFMIHFSARVPARGRRMAANSEHYFAVFSLPKNFIPAVKIKNLQHSRTSWRRK